MLNILESTKYVVDNSCFVKINSNNFNNIVSKVDKNSFGLEIREIEDIFKHLNKEQILAYNVVYNTINFCYWGDPKWEIEFYGKNYGGSTALVKCFARALNANMDILSPEYLKDIDDEKFEIFTNGNITIPLLPERVKQLNILGKLMIDKFEGKFGNIFLKGEYDALKITEVLADDLKEVFCDESVYDNMAIQFYKRAQITSDMVNDFVAMDLVDFKINGLEKLTGLADYKVPQTLRQLGVLEYCSDLTYKIDNGILIEKDSKEENEIRANTIWAIELLRQILIKEYPQVTAIKLDNVLWSMSHSFPREYLKPHHKTITVSY